MNDVILCQHLNWHARRMSDELLRMCPTPFVRRYSAQNMAMFEGNLL